MLGLCCCLGFSLVAVRGLLIAVASLVVGHRLEACSCSLWAQLLHGMWNPPRPGVEPMSPALAGGFLSTASPGKSKSRFPYAKLSVLIRQPRGDGGWVGGYKVWAPEGRCSHNSEDRLVFKATC